MKTKKGSALLLTTILLFVIISMVVSLSSFTILEQKMSQKTKSSTRAFYNSESGIEWALNKITQSTEADINATFGITTPQNGIDCPAIIGGADNCKIYLLSSEGKVITNGALTLSNVKAVRSVGTQNQETQRAIEAAVAGSDERYRISCQHDNEGVGGQLLLCCQIEVDTGITKCKSTPGVAGPWSPYPNPWSSASSGTWGISCGHDLDMLFCCRNDTISGATECKSSDGVSWTSYSPISW